MVTFSSSGFVYDDHTRSTKDGFFSNFYGYSKSQSMPLRTQHIR